MKSSRDCKEFLIDYLLKNPMELVSLYRGASEGFFYNLGQDMVKESNWKRLYKRKEDGFIERAFCLLPSSYDSGVAFTIKEDESGNLSFGEYVGD